MECLCKMNLKQCEDFVYSIAFLLILLISNTSNPNGFTIHSSVEKISPDIIEGKFVPTPIVTSTNDTIKSFDYQDDKDDTQYVPENTNQAQNDQPYRRSYSYGGVRKQAASDDRREQQSQHQQFVMSTLHRDDIQYTNEMHIRQGAIKGIVRSMHAQSGLKSVDQYLGIPYAAPPTGSGRFMPPGMKS